MEEETEKSRGSPRPLLYRNMRRSNSSQLLMESILSEDSPPLPNYERLVQSQSMKSANADEPEVARRPQKPAVQKLINYVFKKESVQVEATSVEKDTAAAAASTSTTSNNEEHGKKKEKKRSSWLPDPEKRWPIQGWY
ncbi:uncharacterized protein [Typha latifolia]|uniref:uncharacterized protein n=1 Tax=Typha latifolia TaxID=4733 RepID=UPI003C2B433E